MEFLARKLAARLSAGLPLIVGLSRAVLSERNCGDRQKKHRQFTKLLYKTVDKFFAIWYHIQAVVSGSLFFEAKCVSFLSQTSEK